MMTLATRRLCFAAAAAAWLALAPGCAPVVDQHSPPADKREPKMSMHEEQARAVAVSELGLSEAHVQMTAAPIRLTKKGAPGPDEGYVGQTAWRVRINGVRIQPTGSIYPNPSVTALSVILHPRTGHIMKVESVARASHSNEPSAGGGERLMGTPPGERVAAFPTYAPRTSFCAALSEAMGNASNAQHIVAYYVLYSNSIPGRFNLTRHPVWVIHLRGIPPIPTFGPPGAHVLERYRDHLRSIIDDQTGKRIFADTFPRPE